MRCFERAGPAAIERWRRGRIRWRTGRRRERRPRRADSRRAEIAGDGRVVAVQRGEGLDDLGAAAMAVHVAEAADVHEDVEAQSGSGVEGAEGFVMLAAMAQAEVDDFGDARGGKRGDDVANLAVGMVADGVEERRGEFDFEGLGALDQVDDGSVSDGAVGEQFCGCLGEFGLGLDLVLVGLGVFDEGGRGADFAGEEGGGGLAEVGRGVANLVDEGLAGRGVDVPCRAGGGVAQFLAQVANLGEGMGEQAGDLCLEGAGVDDLAQRGVGGQRQQVAGNVEGAGLEGALEGLGLEGVGAGNAVREARSKTAAVVR